MKNFDYASLPTNIKFNCIHVYLMTQKVSIKNKAYFQEKNKTKRTPDYSEVRVVKFGGDEENTPVPKYKNRLPNSPRICINSILQNNNFHV